MSDEDIELAVDWAGEEGAFVASMSEVGFLDGNEGARSIHDWQDHNPWAAGAEARSEKARWAALCKQHGRREAARLMPDYASRLLDASHDSASGKLDALPNSASSTPLAGSSSAPSPSPSPPPSPSPSPKTLVQQAARFADFWSVYPVKKGKAEALRKWKARKLDAVADTIIADVKDRMARDGQWLDGFIPHGSTYINGSVWEDDIVPRRQSNGSGATSTGYVPIAGEV